MRQSYSSFSGCPIQDCRILSAGEARILNADDVQVRIPPLKAAHDVVIEILVGDELQHGFENYLARRARRRARMPAESKRES
ncbi:MAG: hypothetical protein ACLQVL_32850, partial [Terriglobia bacterium]